MWMCVLITFSVIGFAWFRSSTKQFVALLNPSADLPTSQAVAETTAPLPFATLFLSVKDLAANIGELFDFSHGWSGLEINNGTAPVLVEPLPAVPVRVLPLADEK